MRKKRLGLSTKAVIAFLATSLVPLLSISPAKAVTFGTDVSDPAADAPYVVSIWTSADNDSRNAEFICSGSLIAPKIVLTAAHCTMETTPYFVKVKAPTLNSNVEFVTVSGVWRSPRYNPKTFVSDIGLLKLDESFEGMPFPTLANAQTAKSINKYSRLRIFGWGLDQELEQTDFLRTADLLLQDASAAKTFGKTFNIKTMLAAGKKIVSENVWSGGCRGDSGGPLISNINGIDVVVGVTSWGSAKCLPNKPTVFNRVSYYFNEIKAGIKAVESSSVNANRSAPVAITNPSISGEAVPGQVLKCNPGSWKNALNVQASWTSPARLIGSSNLTVQVLATDGGSEFKCEVIASSQSASVRRVIPKFVLGKSTLRTNPVIAGITAGSTYKNGQTARCEGWNWNNPVDSERITWFTASSGNPSTPVNGRMIGSGTTLTFTPEILKNEKGRYLICQVTGIKDGFESHFAASQFISTPNAPILGSVSINYYNLNDGSSISCSYSKPFDADEVKVEWGSYTGNYFSAIPWLSGDQVTINKAVIQSAAGKSLACRVTASNLGGESTRTSYTQQTFDSLPNIPTVSTTLSSSNPTSGSYANCYASNTGSYSNTVSYQWGLTRTPSTNTFEGAVLGTSSTFYFTSSNLTQLSGAFLTCVVSVTNGAGTTQANSSLNIPAQSITLPTSNPFIVASVLANNTSVTANIDIPNIPNFNSSTMQARLTITGSPSCVDRNVDPGVRYECAGLSANTTYSGFISVVAKSGNGNPTRSVVYSFTTSGLTGQPVYVCGQSCTGTLSQSAMLSYLEDKRIVEAGAKPGGPITSSTCTGTGCNSGTAPALPVACGTGSSERTSLVANVSAQITTTFRYCSPPLDTTAPTIVDASANYTGYASIIPTSMTPGTNISVRFVAKDAIGITATRARLASTSGTVLVNANGVFQTGSVTDGSYLVSLSTTTTPSIAPDIYRIQVQAQDAAGNLSAWYTLGSINIIAPNDNNSPIITSTSVTPSTISVGQNIIAKIGGIDQVGITGCSISVYNSNNVEVTTSTACTRVGGTAQEGVWQVTININNTNNPGNYFVYGYLIDAAGNRTSLNNVGAFNIAGPSVNNLSTLPTPVTIGINYVDQIVLNGFNFGNLGVSPSGYSWSVRTTLSNGTVVSTLPTGSNQTYITGLQGNTTYKVYLVATDTSGATKVSSALTITTLTPADVQSPTVNISSMTVTPGTLMENGTINVLVPISDNVGVSSVTARIVRNPNSISIPNVSGLSSGNLNLTRSLGTTLSGTWSGSSSMNFNYGSSDGYLIPGIYDIVVSASDVAGNNTTVTKTSAFVLGSQAGGPVIASTDIVPVSGSVTPGSSVKISTRVVAYNQTISSVQISSDGSNLNLTKSLSFVSGTSSDGIFETTITIPNNMNSGTYSFRIIANTANGRTNESTSNISVTYQNGSAITSSIGGSAYYFSGTGHFYQYVSGYRTFENAKFVAQGATAGGKRGYLVTITSGSENSFIQNNIGMSSAWIGASDAASEGCWRWINGTASDMAAPFFAAPNAANCGASAGFTSWMSGEPNDFNGNEDHALILPVGIWNDFTDGAQNLNAPLGFIIEYGD